MSFSILGPQSGSYIVCELFHPVVCNSCSFKMTLTPSMSMSFCYFADWCHLTFGLRLPGKCTIEMVLFPPLHVISRGLGCSCFITGHVGLVTWSSWSQSSTVKLLLCSRPLESADSLWNRAWIYTNVFSHAFVDWLQRLSKANLTLSVMF